MEFKTITAIEATQPAQEAALFWRGFGTSYENKELGLNVEEVVGVVRELRTGGEAGHEALPRRSLVRQSG